MKISLIRYLKLSLIVIYWGGGEGCSLTKWTHPITAFHEYLQILIVGNLKHVY